MPAILALSIGLLGACVHDTETPAASASLSDGDASTAAEQTSTGSSSSSSSSGASSSDASSSSGAPASSSSEDGSSTTSSSGSSSDDSSSGSASTAPDVCDGADVELIMASFVECVELVNYVGQVGAAPGVSCAQVCCVLGFAGCSHRAAQSGLDGCATEEQMMTGACEDVFEKSWSNHCVCE